MERFKNKLQLRMLILTVLMLGLWFLFQFLRRDQGLTSPLSNFQIQLQIALAATLYIGLLIQWAKVTLAVRNPEKLKQLYASEMDECNVLIRQKTHATIFQVVLVALAVGTIIAGRHSVALFLYLLGATVGVGLAYGGLTLFYQRKH